MNERAKLKDLPQSMADRATRARNIAINDPSAIQVDDDMLPWVFIEEEGRWFSFDGNYSASSPEEKRIKNEARELRKEQLLEQAIERAAEDYKANLYWSNIRLDVLKRDKYTCQRCGLVGDSKFHVHHIMKRIEGGTDHYDNLIVVCPGCHKKLDTKLYNPPWVS